MENKSLLLFHTFPYFLFNAENNSSNAFQILKKIFVFFKDGVYVFEMVSVGLRISSKDCFIIVGVGWGLKNKEMSV